MHIHLPIIIIIVIIISRCEVALDSSPIIVLSQFLKPFPHFWMDTNQKESTLIHSSLLSSMLKPIVTLQELLIIEEHLASTISIWASTRCTSSFDRNTVIRRFQYLLWAFWHFVTNKTANTPVVKFQLYFMSTAWITINVIDGRILTNLANITLNHCIIDCIRCRWLIC